MLWFWVLIALLTCTAVAAVAWPLLAGSRGAGHAVAAGDEARRLAVYRDRRREIESERDAGRLSADEARRSLDELLAEAAAQFPGAAGAAPAAKPERGGHGAGVAISAALAAVVLVPVASLAVYERIGAPTLVAGMPTQAGGEPSAAAMDKVVRELSERVKKSPGDRDGWRDLAEAQRMKGDMAASIVAYERAIALTNPPDARLLADYAEAVALGAGGRFDGKPIELLERALAADPGEIKSLVLMGVAQYRAGNFARARTLLKASLQGLPPQSEDAQQIANIIARIDGEAGGGASPAPAPGAAPGTAAPAAAANPGATIVGTISVDDAVRKQLPAGAVLFIVARATSGPPGPPLAVARLAADAWPRSFELGDAQAMDPNRPLSGAQQVVLEARVSASGTAMKQSGDAFGVSKPVKPGARDVAIRIDQRVP